MTPRLNANEAQRQVSQEHAIIKELIKPASFPAMFLAEHNRVRVAEAPVSREEMGEKAKTKKRKRRGFLIMTLLQQHSVRWALPLRARRQRICGRQVHHESLSAKRSDLPHSLSVVLTPFLFLLFVFHHAPNHGPRRCRLSATAKEIGRSLNMLAPNPLLTVRFVGSEAHPPWSSRRWMKKGGRNRKKRPP